LDWISIWIEFYFKWFEFYLNLIWILILIWILYIHAMRNSLNWIALSLNWNWIWVDLHLNWIWIESTASLRVYKSSGMQVHDQPLFKFKQFVVKTVVFHQSPVLAIYPWSEMHFQIEPSTHFKNKQKLIGQQLYCRKHQQRQWCSCKAWLKNSFFFRQPIKSDRCVWPSIV